MRTLALLVCLIFGVLASAEESPRARDLGIPFDGEPGTHNAITDVAGVEVGYTTLIRGDGDLVIFTSTVPKIQIKGVENEEVHVDHHPELLDPRGLRYRR